MPAGARRSLASPVVNGVLCQCGGATGTPSSAAAGPTTPAIDGSGDSSPAASLASSPLEQERRLRSLFLQLDVNRDGALCVHDLAIGLQRLGLQRSERDVWTVATPLSLVFSCIDCLDSCL